MAKLSKKEGSGLKNSTLHQVLKRLFKNKLAVVAMVIFLIEIIIAILAPYIIPYDYSKISLSESYLGPSLKHLFGTDKLGRDLFSRVIYGSRYSLSIGIATTAVSLLFGMTLGAIAGYYGKRVDGIIMRALDVIQAMPGMLLTIVIAAVLGTGPVVTIAALSIGSIAGYARLFRASVLNVRTSEYIEAAKSIGCASRRIIIRHLVPNALSPMIVSATMGIARSITAAASLSFIGLGVQMPIPEWGALLSSGRADMRLYPYLVLFPGLAIMLTVFCLNTLGDGLRDALDPKLKN